MSWMFHGVRSYTRIPQASFFMVLFAAVLVIAALRTIQVKYKGTGHLLDSDRIISSHGRTIAVIVSIIVIYIFLDIGVTYSFTTDKETYARGAQIRECFLSLTRTIRSESFITRPQRREDSQ